MTNQLQSLVTEIINNHSKYDKDAKQYTISLSDVPDFVQDELASLVITNNESLGAEATSVDNPRYESKMLPALLASMQNPTDQDVQIEFVKIWRQGVTQYVAFALNELLQAEIINYNDDAGLLYHDDPLPTRIIDKEINIWT